MKMNKLLTIGLTGLCIITLAAACGNKDEEKTDSKKENTEKVEKKKDDTKKEKNNLIKLGETGTTESTLGTFDVSFSNPRVDPGNDTYKAEGKQFISLDITAKNIDSNQGTLLSPDFEIYDGKGVKGENPVYNNINETVAPDKTYQGTITFDVKNDGPYEVTVGDKTLKFDIK